MNIEVSKQEFMKYVEEYNNTENPKLARKIGHSVRVMENCTKIAESLNLSKKQIEIATIIGLLHDIGKIAQYDVSKEKKIEHGEYGVQILKNNDYIRNYIQEKEYDDLIYVAIKNHGKYQIEEGLTEEQLLFAKIIRDADKLDIFYEGAEMFWKSEEELKDVEESNITDEVIEKFKIYESIDRKKIITPLDGVISFIGFMFDINFEYDFRVMQEQNYVDKILDKFNFKDEKTKNQMKEVREIANKYIEKRKVQF